jgi:hypothetical protein
VSMASSLLTYYGWRRSSARVVRPKHFLGSYHPS